MGCLLGPLAVVVMVTVVYLANQADQGALVVLLGIWGVIGAGMETEDWL